MSKIVINDISMYYEIHGQGEPMVLIAGFGADHTIWGEVADILKANFQVILFDNRGCGQTDVPAGPYTISQLADDVAALCSKLDIKKAHFVGNSMGGYILQALAYQYPNLVRTAVISNSATSTQCVFHVYVDAQLKLLKANAPLAAVIQASCSWGFSYRFLSQPGVLKQLIQLGLDNPYPFSLTGYEAQYAALDKFDSRAWVKKIKVPVLVIGADQDAIFHEPTIKSLADQIPNAQYYCFSECGHLPFMEFPEKFCELVRTFVAKIPA